MVRTRVNTLVMITGNFNPRIASYPIGSLIGQDVTVALSSSILSESFKTYAGHKVKALNEVEPARFDILIVPDGLGNPHRRDYDPVAVAVVRHFLYEGKSIKFAA